MAASASTTAAASTTSSASEEELTLVVKWSGKEYTVRVCGDDSVSELKRRICEVTNVLPKRQKLLYPKVVGPKLADDSVLLSQLPLKTSLKMTMIGYCNLCVRVWLNLRQEKVSNGKWRKHQHSCTQSRLTELAYVMVVIF